VPSSEGLSWYLPRERFEVLSTLERDVPGALPPGFDYYVATTRFGLDRNFPATPVEHSIGRAGVLFAVIRGGAHRDGALRRKDLRTRKQPPCATLARAGPPNLRSHPDVLRFAQDDGAEADQPR
jgi:hypothetical protein